MNGHARGSAGGRSAQQGQVAHLDRNGVFVVSTGHTAVLPRGRRVKFASLNVRARARHP